MIEQIYNIQKFKRFGIDKPLRKFLILESAIPGNDPRKVLNNYIGLNNKGISEVILNEDRDVKVPRILQAIIKYLKKSDPLPSIILNQISRETELPVQIIFKLIEKYKPTLDFRGSIYQICIENSENIKRLTPVDKNNKIKPIKPKEIKNFNLNPKKILAKASYKSRSPGGGPIQKSRLQEFKILNIVRAEAISKAKLLFKPQKPKEDVLPSLKLNDYDLFLSRGVASEKILPLINLIYKLKETNFFKSTFNQEALTNILIKITKGEKVPVPIFNCLSLNWAANGTKYPSVSISSDVNSAITRFNRNNIRKVMETLNTLGNPDYYIVIPDSEIFDTNVWPFSQNVEDRIKVATSLEINVQNIFLNIKTVTWSKYCSQYGLNTPQEYTRANYEKIKLSPNLMREIVNSQTNMRYYLAKYIGEKQAQKIDSKELLDRTIWYFAMYMGEGEALKDSGALSLNFEEGNVPKWFQIGADGNLPIISPSNDIYRYYQWRNNKPPNELIDLPNEIKELAKTVTDFDPLILYIPWGFRETSSFGGKELSAMDIIDQYQKYFVEQQIPFRVLLMTTTPYWTEVNGYDAKTVANYYKDIQEEGKSRGYEVVDWDELRMQRLEKYYELCEFWNEEKIKSIIPKELQKKSKKSAKNISLRTKELGTNAATIIYDRERIVEAQMIKEMFPLAIKFSMAPEGGINDYLDMDLPRMFPLPDEFSYPWWPERRAKA